MMMLRDRRVARTGNRPRQRPLSSYVRPLCLIAALLLDPTSAWGAPPSSSGVRRQRPRIAVVGSGSGSGGDVGAAAARPWGVPSRVWTAVLATAAVRDEGWGGLASPTAMPPTDPSAEALMRERAKRWLLSVRGGSEGLKSEKWDKEKAAAGKAKRGASGGVGEVGDKEGVLFTQGSSSGPAEDRPTTTGGEVPASSPKDITLGVEKEVARVHSDRADMAELGIGTREEGVGGPGTTAYVKERLGRSCQWQQETELSASGRLEPQEEGGRGGRMGMGMGSPGASREENQEKREEENQEKREEDNQEEKEEENQEKREEENQEKKEEENQEDDKEEENDRRRLHVGSEGTAPASDGSGAAVAAAAAAGGGSGGSGRVGKESTEGRGSGEELTPPRRPIAARGDPSGDPLDGPSGGGPAAAGWSSTAASAAAAAAAAGLSDVGSGGDGGGGLEQSSTAAGGSAEGAITTAARRRRAANATAASGCWSRKRTPRAAAAAAAGTGTGTTAHAEHLPRAGAPPPPRGEISVRRPWGRHGAAAVPSAAARVGSGGDLAVWTAPAVRVAGAGRDLAVATGGGEGREGGASDDAAAAAAAAGGGGAGKEKVRRMRWKPKYLTVKAVFFLFYSSLGAIMPYLPVYYHTLGIPDRRIGHLGAITPAMTFIFTPLWGALTDKSGMLKQILVLTFAASTLLRVSLPSRTSFMWIISVITLTAIINAPVRPLLDSSALQSLDDRGEYGKQRLWGQWGFGIGSFVTGKLLSRFGFKAAFYMHAAFSVPTLLILLRFSPKKEDRGKEPPKFAELYRLVVHDVDVLVFFSMVFAIGLSSGVIENFAYKRLRELGGTGSVLGVSRLISSLSGIPMFFFSGAIVKRFSIVGILTGSMMSFIARFVIYACIKNPWAGLPAEALRGVTFAGFWAASTCHVGAIAPPGLSTTMLGLLNATYGGIGQSLGSLIGGSLSNSFGTARAFLVYAAVDTCLLLAFFLFWGLHPNGQQKDRGAGGGIGSSSGGRGAVTGEVYSVPAVQQPLPATAAVAPAAPLQDQTFSPPPPPGVAPR